MIAVYGRAFPSLGVLLGTSALITGIGSLATPSAAQQAAVRGDPVATLRLLVPAAFAVLVGAALGVLLAPMIWRAAASIAGSILAGSSERPAIWGELSRATHGYGGALLAFVLVALLILVSIVTIVGPFILALMWSSVVPVLTFEGLGGRSALRRSSALTKGHKGQLFWVYAVLVLVAIVVSIVLRVIVGAIFGGGSVGVVQWIVQALGGVLVGPLFALTTVEVYLRLTGATTPAQR